METFTVTSSEGKRLSAGSGHARQQLAALTAQAAASSSALGQLGNIPIDPSIPDLTPQVLSCFHTTFTRFYSLLIDLHTELITVILT